MPENVFLLSDSSGVFLLSAFYVFLLSDSFCPNKNTFLLGEGVFVKEEAAIDGGLLHKIEHSAVQSFYRQIADRNFDRQIQSVAVVSFLFVLQIPFIGNFCF